MAARSGWHYISAFLQDVGMSSDQICVCAEAIFVTIDEISAVSVRYRLHQLRSMFGDQLDDPETRFTMELVLRAFEKAGDVVS